MRTIVFELCAESVEACLAAEPGGAHRIELCAALSEGGITPSHGMIREAVRQCRLPLHVMLRPRSGDFVYTAPEFAVMKEDLQHIADLGACGVVLGILTAASTIDVQRTSELVRLAGSLEVTFHRAFDEVARLDLALEDVIATGCHRILTSGGESDVMAGAASLRQLVKQAAGRIDIAVGGGLRIENATGIARATGATHFHGSMRRSDPEAFLAHHAEESSVVRPEDIQAVIQNLAQV